MKRFILFEVWSHETADMEATAGFEELLDAQAYCARIPHTATEHGPPKCYDCGQWCVFDVEKLAPVWWEGDPIA